MTRLPLAVCALLSAVSVFGQIAVREYDTKARLVVRCLGVAA